MKLSKLFLCVIFLIFPFVIRAQPAAVVAGQITDGTNPVEFCNVLVQSSADTTYIKGAVSGADGRFSINVKDGNYKLKVSLLGYGAVEKDITVRGNTDLGKLIIKPTEEQLDEVVVRANLVDALADRYVMNNLGRQPIAAGKSTLEVLKYAPGVWVNRNGAISINGQDGTKIMVNDRLIRFKGQELTTYLESLRAEDIKKLEIIPDPTAEYDADSSGGILSITLDRSASQGISGTVAMNYSQADYPMFMPNLSLNYNKDKWGVSLWYSFVDMTVSSTTEQVQDFTGQQTKTYTLTDLLNRSKGAHIGEISITREINKKQYIGLSVQGSMNGMNNSLFADRRMTDADGKNTRAVTSNANENDGKSLQITANYVYRINPASELKVKADAYLTTFDMTIRSLNEYFDADGAEWEEIPYFRNRYIQYSPRRSGVYSVGADYKYTFKNKSFITSGVKFTYLNANTKMNFDEYDNDAWIPDPDRADDFDYNENISAVYVKYDMSREKWAYAFSARAEYYGTNAVSNTLGQTNRQRMVGIFPTVNIRYYADREKGTSVGLNISRSIDRRSFHDLNPNIVQESDFAEKYGNMYLDPSYINKLGLSATIKYKYNLSLNYTLTDNQYEMVTIANPEVENGIIVTPAKINYKHRLALSAFVPVSIAKWWDMTLNLSGGYLWYNLLDEERASLYGRAIVAWDFSLPSDWTLGISWSGTTGTMRSNSKIGGVQTADFSVNKKLLKKKAAVSFSINDLFNSGNGGRNSYSAPDLHSYDRQYSETRTFMFGFRYSFDYGRKAARKYIEKDNENKSRVM